MDTKPGLMERLRDGQVICAEGYLFELERRGYVSAGAYVPEVVLTHPEAVAGLHREFVRAGSDVVEAFTYYAHREKLRLIGKEDALEEMNRQAIRIAKEVAAESDSLVAADICNTNAFVAGDPATHGPVRAMFEEQVGWAADAGVDFVVAETFSDFGEARLALEMIRESKLPAVVTMAIHREPVTRDGLTPEDCCKRLEDAGADVVGLNCARGPETMLPLLKPIREAVSCPLAALPVPYRTHSAEPRFNRSPTTIVGLFPILVPSRSPSTRSRATASRSPHSPRPRTRSASITSASVAAPAPTTSAVWPRRLAAPRLPAPIRQTCRNTPSSAPIRRFRTSSRTWPRSCERR